MIQLIFWLVVLVGWLVIGIYDIKGTIFIDKIDFTCCWVTLITLLVWMVIQSAN